jgi:Xaa-Pro aminopeptidase
MASSRLAALLALVLLGVAVVEAQPRAPLPSLREQARIGRQWTLLRLARVLPQLMREHGIRMWIVDSQENSEDPVFFALMPPTVMAAHRRTVLVFCDRGEAAGVERLAIGGGSGEGLYAVCRDPVEPQRELYGAAQWAVLRRIVEERKPATIALNISEARAFADGLTSGEREAIEAALGPVYRKRIVHTEDLALDYLDVRLPEMLPLYARLAEVTRWLIERALSAEVISPGRTTDQDVAWWLRERAARLGLAVWFHPSVRVQQSREEKAAGSEEPVTIGRGDVLDVDFGITALRLNTDMQRMAYVLRDGESAPPPGIVAALRNANRLQDIFLARLKPGRTGNQVLAEALAAMRAEGIRGFIFGHPIGDHGHGAGPLIGTWDRQEGVPGLGSTAVRPNTWFSLELLAATPVPEWGGRELWAGAEDEAVIDGHGRASWVLDHQTQYYLVR